MDLQCTTDCNYKCFYQTLKISVVQFPANATVPLVTFTAISSLKLPKSDIYLAVFIVKNLTGSKFLRLK